MYPRKAIESAFKAIAEKLNVYNVELRIYDLSKSNVLMSVFSSKKKFKEEQIWDKLLTKKCSKTKDDLLRPTSPTHPSTNPQTNDHEQKRGEKIMEAESKKEIIEVNEESRDNKMEIEEGEIIEE